MSWFKKISQSNDDLVYMQNSSYGDPGLHTPPNPEHKPQVTQPLLPGFDLADFPQNTESKDILTGQIHCAYCNEPMSEEEVQDAEHWTNKDVLGKMFPSQEVITVDGIAKVIYTKKPICETCAEEEVSECPGCGAVLLPWDNEKLETYGDVYCYDCASMCSGCEQGYPNDDLIWSESHGESFCSDCYSEITTDSVAEAWEEFYSDNPDLLSQNVLQKAAEESPQDASVYIDIFEGLPWASQYGGRAWAEIARTWRKMKHIRGTTDMVPASSWSQAMMTIDHTFDLVHNTGSLFTKAKDSVRSWLMEALNTKRDVPPELWLNKLSSDVKRLFTEYYKTKPISTQQEAYTWARHIYETKRQYANRGIQEINELIRPYGGPAGIKNIMSKYKITASDFDGTPNHIPIYLISINEDRFVRLAIESSDSGMPQIDLQTELAIAFSNNPKLSEKREWVMKMFAKFINNIKQSLSPETLMMAWQQFKRTAKKKITNLWSCE